MLENIKLLAYRTGKFGVCRAVILNALVDSNVIKNADELLAHLIEGVSKWAAETDDGRQAYSYAGSDMNIGDLSNYPMREIVERCPHISDLDIEDVDYTSSFTYDTPLCKELEMDEQ